MNTTTATTSRIVIARDALIQIGESTHHHDQAILPSSLSTMNAIVSSPTKPMPSDDEFEFEVAILMSNKALDRKRRATPVLFLGVTDRRFGQLSRSALRDCFARIVGRGYAIRRQSSTVGAR
jgi:hypothetical protein